MGWGDYEISPLLNGKSCTPFLRRFAKFMGYFFARIFSRPPAKVNGCPAIHCTCKYRGFRLYVIISLSLMPYFNIFTIIKGPSKWPREGSESYDYLRALIMAFCEKWTESTFSNRFCWNLWEQNRGTTIIKNCIRVKW